MSNTDTAILKAGLGLIENIPRVWTTDALGTTQTQALLIDFAAVSGGRVRDLQVQIINPSTTATISWMIVPRGGLAPSPPIVSSYAPAAVSGVPIPPGMATNFVLLSGFDLYVVSSAAATSVAVISSLNG